MKVVVHCRSSKCVTNEMISKVSHNYCSRQARIMQIVSVVLKVLQNPNTQGRYLLPNSWRTHSFLSQQVPIYPRKERMLFYVICKCSPSLGISRQELRVEVTFLALTLERRFTAFGDKLLGNSSSAVRICSTIFSGDVPEKGF